MKIILSIFALSVWSVIVFAQVPKGISYQAIALNVSGNAVVNSNVGLRISVVDNSVSGANLYTETHTKTTNAQGLFNLVIGQGTVSSGSFNAINWGKNSKFLKVEMDVAGGTNFVLIGSTQLLSVPYALQADKIDYSGIKNLPSEVNVLSFMTSSNAYIFAPSGTGSGTYSNSWSSVSISGTPVMRSYNSFLTSSNAYVFAPSGTGNGSYSNSWFSTPISGQPFKIVTMGSFFTGVVTSSSAYAFAPSGIGTGSYQNNWNTIPISGVVKDIIVSNNFIGVLTSSNAYVFGPSGVGLGSYTSSWTSTPISGTPLKIVGLEIGNGIMIITSTNSYVFGPSGTGSGTYQNSWNTTSISGVPFLD